jgi:D-alanyl-D-alanine carboxypeptidase/D-alanyl-D-alanine-endopeptidase (penicillin-binding protein 4)
MSMPRRLLALCLVVAAPLLAPPCVRAADELAAKIDAVIGAPEYKHGRWGILVVDGENGKTVYAHNAEERFAPASVTKLYSCAAALIGLGGDHRFETPVFRRGEVTDGRLHGDLILVASGDLTLGGRTNADGKMVFKDHDHIYTTATSNDVELTGTDPLAGLKELAKQIKQAGIKQIDGDVLIDDRLFEHSRGSGSGPDQLTPIMVNDNLVDVIVSPATKAGEPATAKMLPQTDFVQLVAEGKQPRIVTERVGPQRYTVRGLIAVNAKPVVRICVIDDPTGFARALFIETLRKEGIVVKASILRAPKAELPEFDSYAKNVFPQVALYKSPPLSEALKVTLKVSHNLYASTLPLLLAVKHGKRTLPEGLRQQGKILADLGIDVADISLESGAGGGNADRVTPRVTVQLLQAMAKRKDFAAYKAALPILGVDGTLSDAVSKDSLARGQVLGKTGTYADGDLLNGRTYLRSKALAGVMTSASGKTLFYAIFLNDVPLPEGVQPLREGKQIGRLCEIIYQNTP